jgi:hypothetical protein
LFKAIAQSIYGDFEYHYLVREQIVEFMKERCLTSMRLQSYMLENINDFNEKFESWAQYNEVMSQNYSYGGPLELYVASFVFKTEIRVYTPEMGPEP